MKGVVSLKYLNRIVPVLICLLIVNVSTPALAANEQYVVIDAEGVGTDRASAMNSAWLEGIRQAAGAFIDSKTELNNDQITERIISYSRGLVEKYEVLSVDDSRVGEGIYKMKLRMWIVRDLLRDGTKHATAGSAEVSFSADDIERQKKEDIDARALEARNAQAETTKQKAQTAPELLSAMLERYKPEDFLSCYIPGKPKAVKGQQDKFTLNVEITFNEKLYKEAFIPDLIQVLDQIAKSKKNVTLTRQKDQLRRLADKKGLPLADTSIICRETDLGSEYQLAIYDRPERFGCRLYGFADEHKKSILGDRGVLDKFCGRTNRVRGLLLELLDDNKEILDSVEVDISLPFLISNNLLQYQNWAIHPTIMRYEAMFCYLPLYTEGTSLTFPLTFDLPEEFLKDVRSIRASIRLDESFVEAGVNTRIALNNSAYGYFKGAHKEQEKYFKAEADKGYSLAKIAVDSVNVTHIVQTPNQLIEELERRLIPLIENGNTDAAYRAARILEENTNYETQKRCVQYYIKAAGKDPAAMIRLAEIYEQGFCDVKADSKRANMYYKEGLRLLGILAFFNYHPLAVANLGRAALEGLGMDCNVQLAEECNKICKEAGYNDPEFWLWENYRVALRRVKMPESVVKLFRERRPGYDSDYVSDSIQNPRTCLYLVREKLYSVCEYRYGIGLVNRTTEGVSSQLYLKTGSLYFRVFDGINQEIWERKEFSR